MRITGNLYNCYLFGCYCVDRFGELLYIKYVANGNRREQVWVSHSSISDFLKCPRCYFLRNVYKSKATNRKMTLMSPPLALGQAVHEVIESLSSLPREDRFKVPLLEKFEKSWEKVAGEKGGFKGKEEEEKYKERGKEMISRVVQNPGVLLNKAVKIKPRDENGEVSDFPLPRYKISEEDNIILCGKIDWLEYIEDNDSVHIVDFKTGKNEEDENSLQLLIYFLLAKNCQKFNVGKASYWYIERDDAPVAIGLPSEDEAKEKVLSVAKRIKLARQLGLLSCSKGGCFACLPFEAVLRGEGKFVGVSESNQDIFVL